MPVDFGGSVVSSDELRSRLDQFSQILGRDIRVLRGDMSSAPPVPPAGAPAPAQKPGCLGSLFGAKPAPAPDPRILEGRTAGEQGHARGVAADIVVDGLTTREVSEAAARSGLFDGVGHYEVAADVPAHTHVDVAGRGGPGGDARLWLVGAAGATLGWAALDSLYRRRDSDS
ncbi:MAG TPA: hypothetical protein VM490_10790 [Armatimonadaceae bacterium]|nr:hypothetical protein [Armatimonadaceae bacterium]